MSLNIRTQFLLSVRSPFPLLRSQSILLFILPNPSFSPLNLSLGTNTRFYRNVTPSPSLPYTDARPTSVISTFRSVHSVAHTPEDLQLNKTSSQLAAGVSPVQLKTPPSTVARNIS